MKLIKMLSQALPIAAVPLDHEVVEWKPELRALMHLALPVIVQTAAQQLMLSTDQIFLGHLGTEELAASALGLTFSNLMWFFLLGASTALDTLGAQAYGANNHAALVAVTFTSAVVLSLLCIPVGVCMHGSGGVCL